MTTYQTMEQLKHDRINLYRIVKNLEPVIFSDSFLPRGADRRTLAIKAASTQTTIDYAQSLLDKLKEPSTGASYDHVQTTLDRMLSTVVDAKNRMSVPSRRPRPLLSSMKMPKPALPTVPIDILPSTLPEAELLPNEDGTPLGPAVWSPSEPGHALDNLPSASPSPAQTLRAGPTSNTSENAPVADKPTLPSQPAFLTTSLETQEELSAQLAEMGRQLKLNAIHLSNSLAKEKGTIEDATEKLDRNLGSMTKERVRLRDHSGKSGSTTWMVLAAILCVVIAWILMFFVIRLT